jgi:hypothetical protein
MPAAQANNKQSPTEVIVIHAGPDDKLLVTDPMAVETTNIVAFKEGSHTEKPPCDQLDASTILSFALGVGVECFVSFRQACGRPIFLANGHALRGGERFRRDRRCPPSAGMLAAYACGCVGWCVRLARVSVRGHDRRHIGHGGQRVPVVPRHPVLGMGC